VGEIRLNYLEFGGSGSSAHRGHRLHDIGPFLRCEALISEGVEAVTARAGANRKVTTRSYRQQGGLTPEYCFDRYRPAPRFRITVAGKEYPVTQLLPLMIEELRRRAFAAAKIICQQV
jgi:hypothetical protein